MIRGHIALVGTFNREIELLSLRLEKEGYEVSMLRPTATVYGRIARLRPVAVLVTSACSKHCIDGLNATLKRFRSRVPMIAVVADASEAFGRKGIGEIWCLHSISLLEVTKRLKFAISLCQLAFV